MEADHSQLSDWEMRILHMEVDRTLFLARKAGFDVTRQSVQKVVGSCDRFHSIDLTPSVHEAGIILVEHNWKQLAVDVMH